MLTDNVSSRRNDDRRLEQRFQNLSLPRGEFVTTRQLLDQGTDQDGLLALRVAVIIPMRRARSVAAPPTKRQDIGLIPPPTVATHLASVETLNRSSPSSNTLAS